jgi:hypothetical protein
MSEIAIAENSETPETYSIPRSMRRAVSTAGGSTASSQRTLCKAAACGR